MNIGISTSVIGRGRTGIAQYLFALLRAFMSSVEHRFTLFVLEEDVPLFDFAANQMQIVRVPEQFRRDAAHKQKRPRALSIAGRV